MIQNGNLMLTKFKYVRMKKLIIDVDKYFTNFSDLRWRDGP